MLLADLYTEHADEIDDLRRHHPTVTFSDGTPADRPMTRARVIDIFGFQRAYDRGR